MCLGKGRGPAVGAVFGLGSHLSRPRSLIQLFLLPPQLPVASSNRPQGAAVKKFQRGAGGGGLRPEAQREHSHSKQKGPLDQSQMHGRFQKLSGPDAWRPQIRSQSICLSFICLRKAHGAHPVQEAGGQIPELLRHRTHLPGQTHSC